ncbi:hypothetical protein J2789_003273 [Variovorax paradoxus]|uniref:hypothetical protein n=1 Tax=Variovorax atrisoli TaxID=3394203 RepID=UPI00119E0C35|nr:hypothetical protein [Variovorax paradoxus]
MPITDAADERLFEYRKSLVAAEQKAQEDFDKTVLALSGGALGISFAFLKDVIGSNPVAYPFFLFTAWVTWGFSTFSVLASYHLSHLALRKAIRQVDEGLIYKQRAGAAFAIWTARLNETGAVLFLIGVLCITIFAGFNFKLRGEESANTKPIQPAVTSAPALPASSATRANP